MRFCSPQKDCCCEEKFLFRCTVCILEELIINKVVTKRKPGDSTSSDSSAGASSNASAVVNNGGSPASFVSSKRDPPKFIDRSDYITWPKIVKCGLLLLDMTSPNKGGLLCCPVLKTTKAERILSGLTVDDLNRDIGLETLLEKLDTAYKKDTIEELNTV